MSGTILITGGAGFIGCNLADQLLKMGKRIIILDNLSRKGSEQNLAWLQLRHANSNLHFIQGDVRDREIIEQAMSHAQTVYHLAAQVAVTSSINNPREDFDINVNGTFNVLEAARKSEQRPIILYTSTNKVYGSLSRSKVIEKETRYELHDLPQGVSEAYPLDFHSPYGCSKGAMDQYVQDYARIYGLRTIVFRMSCIYGPRQFGNEDQGWLAHLLIQAALGNSVTIFGNGKQVRDILDVEDLIRAMQLAIEKIEFTHGKVFNIGGGVGNTLSVWAEFQQVIKRLVGRVVQATFAKARPGDQAYYVSDNTLAHSVIGWKPEIGMEEGIERLWEWISDHENILRKVLETSRIVDDRIIPSQKGRGKCVSW